MRIYLSAALLLCSVASASPAQGARGSPPEFVLRPGDVLQLTFWREPALSGDYAIDERGVVVLPVLGPRRISELPWRTVRDSLFKAFDRELVPGAVAIRPLRRLYILGSVRSPGMYLADPEISLAGSIALAGGASPDGDLRRIRVVRDGVTVVERIAVDTDSAPALRSGDQLYVDRRGWFDRNSAVALTSFVGFAGVLLTVVLLR